MKSISCERIHTFCRIKPCESQDSNRSRPAPVSARYFNQILDSDKPIEYDILSTASKSSMKELLRLKQPSIDCIPLDESVYSPQSDFVFDGVIGEEATQDDVFEIVGQPVLDSFLGGINSCICCYGQTGAGKTWTMSGDEHFDSRGLIQRVIESLFSAISGTSGSEYNVMISYMEIYNEVPYDLLGASQAGGVIESFPRVVLQEDETGTLHTRNLSLNNVSCVEEAIDLFLLGNMNRIVSATAMNQASSRSHCIFSIHLESQVSSKSSIVRTSKLHLVDLAGSERVWKTGTSNQNLREAKHINKSLHFLEQVINSLSRKASHIPYRNSVLTSVLRDSLGGNCRTVLVANISVESRNLRESIATCRFAQRCASIESEVFVNEKVEKSTESLLPLRGEKFCFQKEQHGTYSLREIQDMCGSNLSLFPREIRKQLIDDIRAEGMDYRISCVGDLCALVQVLVAKLGQSDEEKRVLRDKLKGLVYEKSLSVPDPSQWRKSSGVESSSADDADPSNP